MIHGYAIYLRTHQLTGKQYGGCVWWTKRDWTAEKSCLRRWRREDRDGIRGLFGGFSSEIVLTKNRRDIPICSEGMYHIRIAVDEAAVIDAIPPAFRLNKTSPLLQLNSASTSEEIVRFANEIQRENNLGIYGITFEQKQAIGRKNYTNKVGLFNIAAEEWEKIHRAGGSKSGRKHKENGTGIFAPEARVKMMAGVRRWHEQHPELDRLRGQKAGRQRVESGHLARISRFAAHMRWHTSRGISKPTCRFCLQTP
jgi:hypothetical protein